MNIKTIVEWSDWCEEEIRESICIHKEHNDYFSEEHERTIRNHFEKKRLVDVESEVKFLKSINTSLVKLYPELKHTIIREVIQKRIEKLQGDDEK